MERVIDGASVRTFAARAAGAGGAPPAKISFTSEVTLGRYFQRRDRVKALADRTVGRAGADRTVGRAGRQWLHGHD
ncbi:hypothetical protein GCM10010245_76540 [Streptomyces spectabilis]|nr:hypothetical protein GCM10010245_76540 [Streptomyces spectabilis]